MDKLLNALFEKHPKPWRRSWTCTDQGALYDTIEDAKGRAVYNPARDGIADELYAVMLALGDGQQGRPARSDAEETK